MHSPATGSVGRVVIRSASARRVASAQTLPHVAHVPRAQQRCLIKLITWRKLHAHHARDAQMEEAHRAMLSGGVDDTELDYVRARGLTHAVLLNAGLDCGSG
ncbi:protein of unknown function [Acidithiobacillus ferrivorans]|uniref:Uncharacterized protein n=1 Tax=Acidithiobacillus ferrivorans TaxID=160808 RepID=A0A060UXY4_9PROT|nr:hypothetical protein AFERRI_560107 [Acidithiobacillus ferrivorans]SMH66160.1 protein of unknown function [Acidithiobacillus ferrivorans]